MEQDRHSYLGSSLRACAMTCTGFNLITLMVSLLAGLMTQTQYHWACVAGLHDLFRTIGADLGPPVWGNALCLFAVKTAIHVPCAVIELMSAQASIHRSSASLDCSCSWDCS